MSRLILVALAISALVGVLFLPAAVGWIRSPDTTPLPSPLEVGAEEPAPHVSAKERRSGPATLRKTKQPRKAKQPRAAQRSKPASPALRTSVPSTPRSTTVARARVVPPDPEPAGTASRRAEPAPPSSGRSPSPPQPSPAPTPPAPPPVTPPPPVDDDDDNEVDDTTDDDDLSDDDFDD